MSAIEAAWRSLKLQHLTPIILPNQVLLPDFDKYRKIGYPVELKFEINAMFGYIPQPGPDFDKYPKIGYPVELEFEINAMFGYIPQPEPEIICPCCKGSGTFTLFTTTEKCGECKGTGKVRGKPADQPGAKGSPDVDYGALGL